MVKRCEQIEVDPPRTCELWCQSGDGFLRTRLAEMVVDPWPTVAEVLTSLMREVGGSAPPSVVGGQQCLDRLSRR